MFRCIILISLLPLCGFGQLSIGERYISLTVDSGYLNIEKKNRFTLCDRDKGKIYSGKWTLQTDTLILNFSGSKTIKTKLKEKDEHIEKLIVSGPRIESIKSSNTERRSYITKAKWDIIRKEQIYVRNGRKMRAK